MKKRLSCLIAAATVFAMSAGMAVPVSAKAVPAETVPAPQITAQTAVLADADSGQILYGRGMHTRMFPASLTKIMTGILAVENGSGSDVITVSRNVFDSVPRDTSNAAFSPGEKISQDSAMYTMFLASANDSALAIAEHIGGSVGNFVRMMNGEASLLGAGDTHFANPSGLPDKSNYSSAYDMALFAKKALQLPKLMTYFGARSYTLPPTNIRKEAVPYVTLHQMMKPTLTKYSYDGVIAGKTGWESLSGFTMVTIARRNGRTLICSTMHSSNQAASYTDTIALLDYGFALKAGATPSYGILDFKKQAAPDIRMRQLEQTAARQPAEIVKTSHTLPAAMTAVAISAAALIFMLPFLLLRRRRAVSRQNKSYID